MVNKRKHFKEIAVVDDELHEGSLMGAKDSCKPFYEVLVDAVHEKKGSLDISLLSTHDDDDDYIYSFYRTSSHIITTCNISTN